MKHARQDYNRIQDPTGKIPANEPVFLLRGQDVCAPFAIQAWAEEAEKRGADPEIIRKARTWAGEMFQYQANVKRKVPDCPKFEVPAIVAGLSFKTNNKGGFITVLEVYDTEPTCMVQAYHKEGDGAWRDIWKVEEMKAHFEKGNYWQVKTGEMGNGRHVVLFDPGAIQTPFEALLGQTPVTWKHPYGPYIFPDNSDAFRKWVGENKGYPFKRMEHETWVWFPDGVTRENFLIEWETYEKAYNPAKQGAATSEGVQCVKCGNWYKKGGVCENCFENA